MSTPSRSVLVVLLAALNTTLALLSMVMYFADGRMVFNALAVLCALAAWKLFRASTHNIARASG